jgi:hypothetical protein
MRRLGLIFVSLLSAVGCNAYRLKPPPGFAEVNRGSYGAHMIAGDKVGLNVKVYENVRGGTLAFWGEELVRKLGERGYTLQRQTPVESKNGVAGTRFDFAYTNPDGAEKFYSAVLFATNEHRVVVQVAGDAEHAQRYLAQVDAIAKDTVARGCRLRERICDGPQPAKLSTPPPEQKDSDDKAPTDQQDALADGDTTRSATP